MANLEKILCVVQVAPAVARIRPKKLQAALAFAAIPTSHRVPSGEDAASAKQTASAAPTSRLRGTHVPFSPTLADTQLRPPASADSNRWF
jgi:hypothetical protein